MPADSALAFLKSIDSRKTLPPAALIFGPHGYLREYVLGAIAGRLGEDGFQYRSFQVGAGDDFSRVLEEIGGADLFASKRLIVCRMLRSRRERETADDSGDASGSEGGAANGEAALAAAIESAAGPNHLVVIAEREAAPARLRRAAERSALMLNCARPFDNQISDYADAFAARRGLRLGPGVAEFLATRHGGDLAAISNAIDKAAIFCDPARPVSSEDLDDPVSRRMPGIFEIAESLGRGRTGQALAQIDRAVALGRDPIEILAVEIIPVMRRMMTAASMLARRRGTAEIATALGLHPASALATRAIEGARRFGFIRIERAYRRASELDAGFKRGAIKERAEAVASLVLELMGAGA
jgi:DNA polymerase III delta subunit